MKFIVVKNFTDVNLDSSSAPELHLEVEGRCYSIVNFRNEYFCESSNTLAGSEGQVRMEKVDYDDMATVIYKCLKPFLTEGESYMILDDNYTIKNFLASSKKYYVGV